MRARDILPKPPSSALTSRKNIGLVSTQLLGWMDSPSSDKLLVPPTEGRVSHLQEATSGAAPRTGHLRFAHAQEAALRLRRLHLGAEHEARDDQPRQAHAPAACGALAPRDGLELFLQSPAARLRRGGARGARGTQDVPGAGAD